MEKPKGKRGRPKTIITEADREAAHQRKLAYLKKYNKTYKRPESSKTKARLRHLINYPANREKILEKRRNDYAANPAKFSERAKLYRFANRRKISIHDKIRYYANRDVQIARQMGYYYRRKDEISARRKAAWAALPEEEKQRLRDIRNKKRQERCKRRKGKRVRAAKSREAFAIRLSKDERDFRRDKMNALKYDLDFATYCDMMFGPTGTSQPKCEVCGKTAAELGLRVLCLDHSHAEGKVRGVLCPACNKALGLLKDNVSNIESLKSYLQKSNEPVDNTFQAKLVA